MCYVPACVQSQFRLGEAAEVRVQQHREGNQEGEDDDNDVRRIDGTQSRQCLEMDPQSLGELEKSQDVLHVLQVTAALRSHPIAYSDDTPYPRPLPPRTETCNGVGHIRLRPDGRCWTLMTSADSLKCYREPLIHYL